MEARRLFMLKKGLMCLGLLILSGCGQGPGAPVVETTIQLVIASPGTGSGTLTIHNAGGSIWTKDFDINNAVTVVDYAYSGSTASFSITYTSPVPNTIDYILGPKVRIDKDHVGPVTATGVVCDPDHTSASVTFE
jgi:hypothetical protein